MFAFLILFIPCILLLQFVYAKDKTVILTSVGGVVCGIITCICVSLFFSLHNVFSTSFFENFGFFASWLYFVIPLMWIFIYFLISKDSVRYKLETIHCFLLGFFTAYLPYFIIFSDTYTFSFYEIFMKPVIVCSMCLLVRFFIMRFCSLCYDRKSKICILYLFAALINMVIPAVFEALWITKSGIVLLFILMSVYMVSGFFAVGFDRLFNFIKSRKNK